MDLKLAVFLVSTTKVDNLFNLNTEVYWIFGHVTCPANYNARTIDTDTYSDATMYILAINVLYRRWLIVTADLCKFSANAML